MNPNQPQDPWSRLVQAARRSSDPQPVSAPFGFSTRVAALAAATERVGVSLFERFAFRAVSFACLLACGSILLNFSLLTPEPRPQAGEDIDDPVAVLLAE
jgi:hypothetical protein